MCCLPLSLFQLLALFFCVLFCLCVCCWSPIATGSLLPCSTTHSALAGLCLCCLLQPLLASTGVAPSSLISANAGYYTLPSLDFVDAGCYTPRWPPLLLAVAPLRLPQGKHLPVNKGAHTQGSSRNTNALGTHKRRNQTLQCMTC